MNHLVGVEVEWGDLKGVILGYDEARETLSYHITHMGTNPVTAGPSQITKEAFVNGEVQIKNEISQVWKKFWEER